MSQRHADPTGHSTPLHHTTPHQATLHPNTPRLALGWSRVSSGSVRFQLICRKLESFRVTKINPRNALQFFTTVGKLKLLKRTGWVYKQIPQPESVADHMYRMAMLAFLITDPDIEQDRLIKICLIHDLAESIVGDITPHDGINKEDKRRLEENALRKIASEIGDDDIATNINDLWHEYELGVTKLAKVAKQLDKFEMIVQADEYEKAHHVDLSEFFASTYDAGYFTHPEVASWANELIQDRKIRLNDSK